MEQFYIILTDEFCAQYDGYQNGVNVFTYRETLTGLKVASSNVLNTFPELFTTAPEIIKLSITDFPQTIDE
jgi:hypothetical protein